MATIEYPPASSTPDLRAISQPPPDPDIQVTLSDFLTYTEHFPSLLTRALTLIGEQRQRSEGHVRSIHDATTTYALPPSTSQHRPHAAKLRADISHALEEAETASRMAVEEAKRLADTADVESRRLDVVVQKLNAAPMPPSRDPTPEAAPLTSPNLRREGQKMDTRASAPTARYRATDKSAIKARERKVMVPGEVLPPPDPNALPESISSWTSPNPSPPPEPERVAAPVRKEKTPSALRRSRTPKVPKVTTLAPNLSAPKQSIKMPKRLGTNAHSSVAGISTSNALLALTAPHEDAKNGSRWLPWTKLTEWEMAKLRKRMKKNAIWHPSLTMVKRELKNLGRGVGAKVEEKARCDATGDGFFDDAHDGDPTKVEVSGEETKQMNELLGPQTYEQDEDEDADAALINRGMRLNEAKKLKRQRLLEEQALQAQIEGESGLSAPVIQEKKKGEKRKRESTPASTGAGLATETPDPLTKPAHPPKKIKIAPPQPPPIRIPLAPAGSSSSPRRNNAVAQEPQSAGVRSNRSILLKPSKAASAEPPNRRNLRRGSNASLPSSTKALASPIRAEPSRAGRRPRRPAPGVLTTNDEESAKVGVSRRKAAPKKRSATASKLPSDQPSSDPMEPIEPIDPDEPRYCICGDVSWGTMIACDNDDCEKEWFHLSCVGLADLPPRRTKWYCPDCRKRLRMGQGSNGLVGKTANAR